MGLAVALYVGDILAAGPRFAQDVGATRGNGRSQSWTNCNDELMFCWKDKRILLDVSDYAKQTVDHYRQNATY